MVSIESYVVFAVFLAEVVKEEKSDKLTSNILLWFFLSPGGLVVK